MKGVTILSSESVLEPFGVSTERYGVIISVLLLLATLLGSVASFASFGAARKNNQSAKLGILNELSNQWLLVQDNWILAQAIVRGADDYYSPTLPRQEKLIALAHKQHQKDWLKKNVALNQIRAEIEVLVQFFDRLSMKILEGSLTPSDAYSILGPTVARHSRVVRWTVGAAEATPGLDGRFRREPDFGWVDYPVSRELRGRRSRVIYLTDALWAELAQTRDLEAHNISSAAVHKQREGTGLEARKRAFELARKFGSRPIALKLSYHLTHAEYVSTEIFTDFGIQGFSDADDLAFSAYDEIRTAGLVRSFWRRVKLLRLRLVAP